MTTSPSCCSVQIHGDRVAELVTNPAIVLCGHDPLLLMTRESLLVQGGYRVRPRGSVGAVIREMKAEKPELIVVCHTFSPVEVEELLMAAYEIGCEKVMLLSRKTQGVEVVVPGVWRVSSLNPRLFLRAVEEELADERRWSCPEDIRRMMFQA